MTIAKFLLLIIIMTMSFKNQITIAIIIKTIKIIITIFFHLSSLTRWVASVASY